VAEIVVPWETTGPVVPVVPPQSESDEPEIIVPWIDDTITSAQETYDEYNWLERQIAKTGIDPEGAASLGRRIVAETVPAVEGAAVGARLGAPGGPVGRATGAALGGAVGALTGKRIDEIFGNVRPDEQNLISDIITAAGGAIAAPGKAISPNTAREIAKILERRGIKARPTPGMVTDRQLIQAIEQKLTEIPFSGGSIESAVRQVYDDFARAIEHLSDDATLLFAAPSAAGEAIAQGTTRTVIRGPRGRTVRVGTGAQSKLDAFRARGTELYGIAKTLMKGANPSVTPNETLAFIAKEGGFDNAKLQAVLGDEFLERLGGATAGPQTWKDMNLMLQSIGRKTKFGSDQDIGTMKQLWKAIHNDMDETAKTLGPNVRKSWEKARHYWSRAIIGKEEELGKIAKHANPQRLFDALMGKGNLTAVTTAKKAVDANTWKSVQELVIRRMGEVPGMEGQFNLSQFLTSWKRISHDSNATKALFGNKLGDMKELVSIARRLNNPSTFANTSKTAAGNVMLGFLTGGGTMGVGVMAGIPEALGVMATTAALPAAVARIWTSRVLMKWLLRGKDIPTSSYAKTAAWAKAFLKMSAAEGINETDALGIYDFIMAPYISPQADVPSVPTQ